MRLNKPIIFRNLAASTPTAKPIRAWPSQWENDHDRDDPTGQSFTYCMGGANEPSQPAGIADDPSSRKTWLKIVALEVRLEEPPSGRDAHQEMSSTYPAFPHEIDGDLAD